MNCKQGDLAIIVRTAGSGVTLGMVVTCVKLIGAAKFVGYTCLFETWLIDPPLPSIKDGILTCYCPDAWLKPIRDQDGEDEMLRIAGKPERMTA